MRSQNQHQTLKHFFCHHIHCAQLGTKLVELSAQSQIHQFQVLSREFRYLSARRDISQHLFPTEQIVTKMFLIFVIQNYKHRIMF